jgi:2-hydroxy-3-oxopropionate reductase
MVVGFIGLGTMGLPMACNLVAAGISVVGYNHSSTRLNEFLARGGSAARSVAEVAAISDIVITMLPDGPDVEGVVLGATGVIANARESTVLVDMSTIHPEVSARITAAAESAGMRSLDAPVSGGERGAIDGTLSVMVGGDQSVFDSVLPVLSVMGGTVTRVGGSGSGQIVKAANQLIVAVTLGVVAEALTLLEALKVDTSAAASVMAGGLAGSRVLDQKAGKMLQREYSPGFRSELHHKDLGIALAIARDAGVVTPLGSLVAQEMAALVSGGHGGLDHSGLKAIVDQLSGRA